MTPLPLCEHRGRELAPDRYECPKLISAGGPGVPGDVCRHRCPDSVRESPVRHANQPPRESPAPRPACAHLGADTGRQVKCKTCKGTTLKVLACAVHGACTVAKPADGLACCATCPDHKAPAEPFSHYAPLGATGVVQRWEGRARKKPWHFKITAAVPHLDTLEPLQAAVELLRRQTERPYLIVVDTGSPPAVRAELEKLRAEDLEVHYVAGHAWRHASEPVTVALDLAQSLCRSEYLFHTHADVFLRRRDFLADWLSRCGPASPVVGYRLSPRTVPAPWADEWRSMLGHSLLLTHMPTVRKAGAQWSFQRIRQVHGYPWVVCMGWPDTEVGWCRDLQAAGIEPVVLGEDRNYEPLTDANHTHVRSYASGKLYSRGHYARAQAWMRQAVREARELAAKWDREDAALPSESAAP